MDRIPEPELMDDPAQARAYAGADFSEPHNHFIELFVQRFGDTHPGTVLDLGCGPGDICRRFASTFLDCRIHAVDGSGPMLELGESATRKQGLQHRVEYFLARLPDAQLPEKR
jgi:ubiquinone/menaquinone biosynthesis C-methylase UbiE